MKKLLSVLLISGLGAAGCATLTSDAMDPVALSFSDGSSGTCTLTNKRGVWQAELPLTIPIRRSDDALKYECETDDGREAVGSIESGISPKLAASVVFIDFGITDAITDKHRDYPESFVIPVKAASDDQLVGEKADINAPGESSDAESEALVDEEADINAPGKIADASDDNA